MNRVIKYDSNIANDSKNFILYNLKEKTVYKDKAIAFILREVQKFELERITFTSVISSKFSFFIENFT